ncbi:hypothetical protein ACIBUY_24015 [Streptomyces sp. NPDC050085]|uniref:hypothetical protein n=1 Tax=Streptomyces sp. NPDC050085 TaxID=3365600 RepID=UPI0037B8E32D
MSESAGKGTAMDGWDGEIAENIAADWDGEVAADVSADWDGEVAANVSADWDSEADLAAQAALKSDLNSDGTLAE